MKLEIIQRECFYHIYNRGINGETIFINDENKKYFLKLLDKYLSDKISVFAYCLLNNHFHLAVKIDEDEKVVTQSFSNLFNAYAKAFNDQNNRTGSLFEKHFKRIKLNSESYLQQLIIYIHLNPSHHFDLNFDEFNFSSYKSILSEKRTKVEREKVINLFEDIENFVFCHRQKNEELNEKYTFE